MAKSFVIVLIATFIFSQEVLLSTAAPASDAAFQEWLLTFDPSKTPASKADLCSGKPNGFYPIQPNTCSPNYIACVSFVAYTQSCAGSKVFDEVAKACQDTCSVNYPPPTCTGTPEGINQPTEACGSLYYFCVQGQIYFKDCSVIDSKKPLFDVVMKTCIGKPDTGPCSGSSVPPTVPPTVPPFGCSDKDTLNYYAMGPCSPQYYKCTSTTEDPVIMTCSPTTTVFDYGTVQPVGTTPATCIATTVANGCKLTTTTVKPTTKKPFTCPASSGSFPIPGATCCINYYSCSGSVANKVNCPNGYYFEPSKSACISKTSASSICPSPNTCTY